MANAAVTTGLCALAGAALGGLVGVGASKAMHERPADSPFVGLGLFLGMLSGAAIGGNVAAKGAIASTLPPKTSAG